MSGFNNGGFVYHKKEPIISGGNSIFPNTTFSTSEVPPIASSIFNWFFLSRSDFIGYGLRAAFKGNVGEQYIIGAYTSDNVRTIVAPIVYSPVITLTDSNYYIHEFLFDDIGLNQGYICLGAIRIDAIAPSRVNVLGRGIMGIKYNVESEICAFQGAGAGAYFSEGINRAWLTNNDDPEIYDAVPSGHDSGTYAISLLIR